MVDWWQEPADPYQAVQAPPQRLRRREQPRRWRICRTTRRIAIAAAAITAIDCLVSCLWLPESDSCTQHPALSALPRTRSPGDAQETHAAKTDASARRRADTTEKPAESAAGDRDDDLEAEESASRTKFPFPKVDPEMVYNGGLEAVVRTGWMTQTIHIVPILPHLVDYWEQASPGDLYPFMRICPQGPPHLHVLVRTRGHQAVWTNETEEGRLKSTDYHGHHVIVPLEGGNHRFARFGYPRLVPISPGLRRRINFDFLGKKPRTALELVILVMPANPQWRLAMYFFYPVLFVLLHNEILYTFMPFAMKIMVVFFSFVFLTIVIWPKIRGRWAKLMSRRYRLRLLRSMRAVAKRESPVYHQEDCCICLDELTEDASLFMLLPCKHVVHESCYCRWICSYCYVNRQLRCPLCSVQVTGLGIPLAAKPP